MEEKNEIEIMDDVMLPGFRFHPTDEELVGFYLRRKIQQKSIPIEIIKQVDIYKYDPWDLPKMASSGEKEMYFFCQRDRKYRNSARPNRVTKGGFWKATGTDRPIYSSHHGKCIIGLKKSLVFYRGRAAKGTKTEWMMHEFRLPSSLPLHSSLPSNKTTTTTTLPPSESWAICRIFKKPNSTSNMVQKALYKPWISHLPETMVVDDMLNYHAGGVATSNCNHFSPQNSLSSKCPQIAISIGDNIGENTESSIFSTMEGSSSMLFNGDSVGFEGTNQHFGGFSVSVPQDMLQANVSRGIGFPFSLLDDDAWKSTMQWDSPLMF